MNAASPGPLAGLKVVEICSTIAGPACARLLADFGADVTKVEPLEGDGVRQMGRHVDDVSLYAATILRGKRSVSLDLKSEQGRAITRALVDRADILVENNRPGVMERLGLDYDTLSATNPGLVMVRISGYGQDGPYAGRPGYGAICEAFGGVRHMTGDPDRPPARVALATTDYLTAVYAAFGAMMAIHERGRTGLGQVVDAALYETSFSQMEPYVPAFEKLGFVPKRVGPNLPTMAPNSLYPSADGAWVLIAANSNIIFSRLAQVMGQPELLADPRFATIRARGERQNMTALDAIIGAWTRQHDAEPLEQLLIAESIPASRIYTIADIYEDPHYAQRGMLVRVPHDTLGHTTQAGVVPKLSRTPGHIRHSGPDLGADTQAVLQELGMTAEDIQALQAQQLIKTRP
ncbi:CaiB/BaiF CoA-transferase family protein [Bordetella sp. BOR01]|uniref:CaiB/BaiF CoA transferase family protein n=1 Tax=Bordetella sp. BOR01 TaxID=2854779 RepID=UPI001C447E0E|nr:CoA transferase [Bordetella sp. BOR01]MBV7484573.1 CoA transferase [Bordetella sp. BOR01]